MVFLRRDGEEEEEMENPEDEDAALADDVLDEVEGDADDIDDSGDIEGFGLIAEEEVKDEDEDEDEEDGDESLEDDAEDVDFDTFDDVDEL